MQLLKRKALHLLTPIWLLTATGCGKQVTIRAVFPPVADVELLQKDKPEPTPEILTDSKKNAEYNAQIESWGEGLSASGRRLCVWLKSQGMTVTCKP